jgi:trk system potassium uptake protein TrkA
VHVVIMGCGRVGSDLALTLAASHHTVAVIDQSASAFDRLGPDFPGTTVLGVGFDRGRLIEAGIEKADAFAAVSSGDNSNILAARAARETFGVNRVVARIYDPGRAEIYTRLGIPTVATVRWTADQILRRIDPTHAMDDWRDPSGRVVVAELALPATWVGTEYAQVERLTGTRVVSVNRYGEGNLVVNTPVVQIDDIVHVAAPSTDWARIKRIIAAGPQGASS